MEYYHNLITDKSWQILQQLRKKYQFILIGGWAVFLYSQALKSKDIDIIVDYNELEKFRNDFQIFKNERLKKYEIKIEGVDIDVYLPFFSHLGLPAEEIIKHIQSRQGFKIPRPEILLLLKVYAFDQRQGSVKGEKDILDIFSLLKQDLIDWSKYCDFVNVYKFQPLNKIFIGLIKSAGPLKQLGLNAQAIAKLKKKILVEIKK